MTNLMINILEVSRNALISCGVSSNSTFIAWADKDFCLEYPTAPCIFLRGDLVFFNFVVCRVIEVYLKIKKAGENRFQPISPVLLDKYSWLYDLEPCKDCQFMSRIDCMHIEECELLSQNEECLMPLSLINDGWNKQDLIVIRELNKCKALICDHFGNLYCLESYPYGVQIFECDMDGYPANNTQCFASWKCYEKVKKDIQSKNIILSDFYIIPPSIGLPPI